MLYLAWLKGLALAYDVDQDALEPPVPPGLGNLTAALDSFVELFDVDANLLQVAAEHSARSAQKVSKDDLGQAIAQLSPGEKDAFLLRLAQGEPHLSLALTRRLGALRGVPQPDTAKRRTVSELLAAAEALQARSLDCHCARTGGIVRSAGEEIQEERERIEKVRSGASSPDAERGLQTSFARGRSAHGRSHPSTGR